MGAHPQEAPYGLRQLAAVVLKKHVKEHWTFESPHFREPPVDEGEKAQIRELLPVRWRRGCGAVSCRRGTSQHLPGNLAGIDAGAWAAGAGSAGKRRPGSSGESCCCDSVAGATTACLCWPAGGALRLQLQAAHCCGHGHCQHRQVGLPQRLAQPAAGAGARHHRQEGHQPGSVGGVCSRGRHQLLNERCCWQWRGATGEGRCAGALRCRCACL